MAILDFSRFLAPDFNLQQTLSQQYSMQYAPVTTTSTTYQPSTTFAPNYSFNPQTIISSPYASITKKEATSQEIATSPSVAVTPTSEPTLTPTTTQTPSLTATEPSSSSIMDYILIGGIVYVAYLFFKPKAKR